MSEINIVEPSVELLWITENAEKQIEAAGRICYKSENLITDDSAHKFSKMMFKSGHHAMIEHASASFKIITDRGVSHEIVRHRLASYAQECVVGSTIIKTGSKLKTIKELYGKYSSPNGKTHLKTMFVKSVDEDGIILNNKIVNVFYKGVSNVYRVKTKLGYEIACTDNHRFLSKNNYIELKNLSVGSNVMVNGRSSIINISDEKIKDLYLVKKLSPIEISEQYGIPYRPILNKLKKIGIFEKRKNDKNPEKYTKNHTQASYKKAKLKILEQYENGREPWNKGLTEYDHPSIKKQADALREFHHDQGDRSNNSNWKGDDVGISGGYTRSVRWVDLDGAYCFICKKNKAKERHHIDRNPKNSNMDNIIPLCVNCHKKIHKGWHVGNVVHEDEIVSIEYVGVDDVYDIEMKHPYHNYIADGFVTHNSSRYCNYSKDKFGNKCSFIQPPDLTDSQKLIWLNACIDAEKQYFDLLKLGCKAEIARSVLPSCTKTEIVMTANIREFLHFVKLRSSKAAHPQIRPIAIEINNILSKYIPSVFGEDKK